MLKYLLIGTAVFSVASFIMPAAAQAGERQVCGSNGEGPSGTYNKAFWTWFKVTDRRGNCIVLRDDDRASFNARWDLVGEGSDAVGGMGWSRGSRGRKIEYQLNSMSSTGKASFGVYGWTCGRNVIEYYVVETWGDETYVPFDPDQGENGGNAIPSGTVTSDGATYDLYRTRRYNAGNACGDPQDFWQNWSVRRSKRSNGTHTVSMGNHSNAWAANRWFLGDFDSYQVMAPEGLNTAKGSVDVGFVREK